MQLNELYLHGFRNYDEATARFVPGVNLLVGDNANGKTNLLEAIVYLSTGGSFRTRREAELIRFGAEFADLSAQIVSDGREQALRAILFSGRRPRQLWRNGVKQKSAAGIAGALTTVLFCPEDLLVLKKGAAPRRRLLDTVICQLRPNYAAIFGEYQRVLEQKSAVLREDDPSMRSILPDYNERLVQLGAPIISYRARFLEALDKIAASYHKEFSGDRETLAMAYQTVSSVTDPFASLDVLREQLAAHQATHARAEAESRQCLSGPHRDDFLATINGLPVAAFASQGQTRTAAISVKLAQRELLRRDNQEEPLLLLDDVLSELDVGRQDFVLNHLLGGQVFITCCETDRLTDIGQVLRIDNGCIFGGI